ncbi:MAG: TIGR03936 family radical SAM-associated protein [Oscillospiraceae bacterium]|jgi:radical SAM-linked protein|nr:TIGR03936 family radical SAM-associated protein [Oscillospiraceae bacterium]
MSKARLRMSKLGTAKYISHLDFMRTMRRAFTRAEIPLRYSEGFNPHPLMSFALPLSVGQESVCELLDFETSGETPPDALRRLNRTLPEGISATELYDGGKKPGLLRWVEVRGLMYYDAPIGKSAVEALTAVFAAERIIARVRTKRGEEETDIAPRIRGASFGLADKEENGSGGVISVLAVISAQNPTLNPTALTSAAEISGFPPRFAEWRRMEVYDEDMRAFR